MVKGIKAFSQNISQAGWGRREVVDGEGFEISSPSSPRHWRGHSLCVLKRPRG